MINSTRKLQTTENRGMSSFSGERLTAETLIDKKPLILDAIVHINEGVNLLGVLLQKGFLRVDPEEDGQEAVDIVHQIADATNNIKYNAARLRDTYDLIGTRRNVTRFFNFDGDTCIEVSKEEFKGHYQEDDENEYQE